MIKGLGSGYLISAVTSPLSPQDPVHFNYRDSISKLLSREAQYLRMLWLSATHSLTFFASYRNDVVSSSVRATANKEMRNVEELQ